MEFKTWWYDSRSTKWQILIGTLLICIFFIGTFSFLDSYQFEEWKYSGFSKSIIGILMGTVALGVITGIIIIFQSIVATDKEKNQKIFDQRLSLYKDFTKQTMTIISDNVLDNDEREQLKIIEKEVLMIASNETYKKWVELYNVMLQLKTNEKEEIENEEEIVLSISDKSVDFVNSCRMDLEIGVIDKATIKYSKEHSRTEIKKLNKFSKTIYNGFEAKVSQLKDKDYSAEGIEIWMKIWSRLDELAETTVEYRISYAESGCSFNNDKLKRKSKQLLYVKNPGKQNPGFNVSIRAIDLDNMSFLDSVKKQFGLDKSSSLFINDGKDHTRGSFTISNKLYSEVGAETYEKIINFCIDKLTD
jgi:hypothetical protein